MTTLAEFEDFTTPDLRKKIVESVFESWVSLSKDSQETIKDAVGPIAGFRPGKPTPMGLLKAEAHRLARKFPDFFAQVIMPVWMEANPELVKLTADHMQATPPLPNFDRKALDGYCIEQAEALTGENDKYDREEILVMLHFCAMEVPMSREEAEEREHKYHGPIGLGMMQFLMWMEGLPPESEEWEEMAPAMVDDLRTMISQKERELAELAEASLMLTDVRDTHSETLAFFQADTSDWSEGKAPWVESRETLQREAKSLKQALEEYEQAVRPGANLAEERRLREQREGLEKAVESRIKQINEMLQEARGPDESLSHLPLQTFIEKMDAVIEEMIEEESGEKRESVDEGEAVEAEEQAAMEERAAQLEIENRELKDDVRRLQRDVTLWRNSYETERRSKDDSEPDPIPAEFTDVAHVLEVAERRFADRLLFKFNSASDKKHPYNSPYDVWKALEWLAITYYDARNGSRGDARLDESLRQVSRFHYTPHQSDNTIGMYPESYFTRINGIKIPLKEHVGAGVDRKPGNTIRIAFNWDEQSGKVIVGYIGLHQHNRKT